MALLVRLDKTDMDRVEEAIEVLRWILLGHGADFNTNGFYRKAQSLKLIEGVRS